jgi:predicted PurR-regulated permease PerM
VKIQIPRWIQLVGLPVLILLIWFSAAYVIHAIYLFVSAAVIALIMNPLIKKLEWVKVPRYLGVFLVYIAILGLLVLFFILIIPPALTQLQEILDNSPQYAETVRKQIESWKDISIYMLLDAKRIGRFVKKMFPEKFESDADEFILRSQRALTQWIRAQVVLGLIVGASTALGIWLLGVAGIWPEGSKYAVFFGAWAGVTEFIPYIGPILGAIPPVVVALFTSPWAALAVIILFIVIQQLEGHILVPNVMSSVVGVHPLIVIFAVLAGAEIAGIVGMILALPLVALGREMVCFFKPRLSLEKWYQEPQPPVEGVVDNAAPAEEG